MVDINRGPGNEPNKLVPITRSALFRKLEPDTKLTLIFTTPLGAVNKHRTVEKATKEDVILVTPEGERSYMGPFTNCKCFETEVGFCVVKPDGVSQLAYAWGHVERGQP